MNPSSGGRRRGRSVDERRPSTRPEWRREAGSLWRLAVPVVVVQLGLMGMGVADTVMVGRVSAEALAAVAMGGLYALAISIFGMGILMALDPLVAQAVGARDGVAVARSVQRGLLIATMLAVPASLALLPAGAVLRVLRQPEAIVPDAAGYVRALIPGMFPLFAFIVLRQSLQAMHRMRPVVATIVIANLANIVLNWILIFGRLGAPAYGPVGAAVATSLSRWLMAAALLALGWRALGPSLRPLRREAFALKPLGRTVMIGLPIGAQYFLEISAFSLIALFMGWLGTREIAGHQIALNLASVSFMVPLGISAAASVRVGNAVGRGDPAGARSAAMLALVFGTAFMGLCGGLFILAPGPLARLYTNEPAVAALAATLIPIAGFFQVFDGIQVVSIGIMRGLGDTRTPMIVNVLGFWLLGIPLSAWLGFGAGLGARGLWWGLVAALACVAVFLVVRVRIRLRGEMTRLVVDEEPAREVP